MNVNKRSRGELKGYFQKNDIPTESNFAELIDGMLNQKDDGLVRMPGDPLSIEAAAAAAGPKKLLNFYDSFNDAAPSWSLSLNPTAVPGFTISDGAGTVRLFIDQKTGFVGIGTTSSQALLDVGGQVRIGLDENGSGPKSISFARDREDEGNAGKIAYNGFTETETVPVLSIVGAGKSVGTRAIKLLDNVEVAGNVVVRGTLAVDGTLTAVLNTLSVKNGQNEFSYNGDADVVLKSSRNADIQGKYGGRALTHDSNNILTINSGNDFTGGVRIDGLLAPLDVGGQVRIGLDENGSGPKSISFARDREDEVNAGKIAYKGFPTTGTVPVLSIIGAGKSVGTRAIKLWDNVEVYGRLTVTQGTIQRGSLESGLPITTTSDLGLYSLQNGISVRFVTNKAPFYFFTDPTNGIDPQPGVETEKAVACIALDGSFTSRGNKKFKITHPNRAGFDLIHSCLEGPENGVYYRGEGRLVAGHAVVMLPEYFEALTRPEGVTVQLTPKGPRPFLLSYSDVSGGSFHVHGTQDDGVFAWELKAVRADLAPLEVEVPSAERNGVAAAR
jgi:hypothetical protein